MTPTSPTDWHFPLRCTRCGADAGHPFRVQSKSVTELVVSVRCGACHHEWVLDRETPTLAPKPIRDENTPD
jgi:hypothetical protein